jgi:hypothetical protein
MTYAFISYKREDEMRAGRIARALESAGIELWWDRGLPGGESWQANIEAKLADAGCVVVMWSHGSIAPDGHYVRDEARRGLARNILVPVLIDRIKEIPLGFGEALAIDLSRWKGNPRDPFFTDLIAAVRAKLAGTPVPKPNGPTTLITRRLLYGGSSGVALAAIALMAFNVFGAASTLCTIPGLQPGLSDACGVYGVGARPTRAERQAWAARAPGSCPALRDHIARFPDGAYRRTTHEETWVPVKRELAQFVPADGPGAPSEAAAKAGALDRTKAQADRLCRGFGAGTLYRVVAAASRADSWSCSRVGAGVICGFDGVVECELEERRQVEHEVCGATQ